MGISYDSDVRLAMALCVESAQMVPRVQKEPEPRTQLMGFGDNSVNLEVRFWVDDPETGRANVINEVFLNIRDKFHQHGISFPFPQRDLHIRSVMGETQLDNLKSGLNQRDSL